MFVPKSTWIVLAISLSVMPALSASAGDTKVTAVLELFTSQGCASCPPADEVLEDFAKRDDVVALSLPVDYWDYLGWKDTLASHEFTDRQKAYANARGDRQIYTPQMIVNGTTHVVGSDRTAIEAVLKSKPPLAIAVQMEMVRDAIHVRVGESPGLTIPQVRKATIWLALYKRQVAVPVRTGENQDRTLHYYNVVTKLRPIAMWRGEAVDVDLPMSEYHQANADGCAILLQSETANGEPGEILGAAFSEKGAEW